MRKKDENEKGLIIYIGIIITADVFFLFLSFSLFRPFVKISIIMNKIEEGVGKKETGG